LSWLIIIAGFIFAALTAQGGGSSDSFFSR